MPRGELLLRPAFTRSRLAVEGMTAPTREEHADAREELARLQQSYEARLRALATKVRATQEDVRDDLVLEQMGRDPCSAAYVQERLGEEPELSGEVLGQFCPPGTGSAQRWHAVRARRSLSAWPQV